MPKPDPTVQTEGNNFYTFSTRRHILTNEVLQMGGNDEVRIQAQGGYLPSITLDGGSGHDTLILELGTLSGTISRTGHESYEFSAPDIGVPSVRFSSYEEIQIAQRDGGTPLIFSPGGIDFIMADHSSISVSELVQARQRQRAR